MKPIPGHDMYAITEEGLVWSYWVHRFIRSTLRIGDVSYYKVGLLISSNPKKYKHLYIHQLVMLTFVGPCPEGMQVDHIDGNSTNNDISNLRYVSPKRNIENRTKHGKHYTSFTKKINKEEIVNMKKAGYTHREISEKLSVSERQISRLIREE